MAEIVQLKSPQTGVTKDGFYGYSWTTLFFGPFPALFRADFVTFIGYFVIALVIGLITAGFGLFVMSLIWSFFYNSYYTKRQIERGYKFSDTDEKCRAASQALGVDLHAAQNRSIQANAAPSTSAPPKLEDAFYADKDLASGAYQLYLVKKYAIEKNATLEKYVIGDQLLPSIEDALAFCDNIEKRKEEERLAHIMREKNISMEQVKSRATVVRQGRMQGTAWTYKLYGDGSVAVRDGQFEQTYKSIAAAKAELTWWTD